MLVFTPSAERASERVEIWRKLKRMGALPFGNSGHLLSSGTENQENFEWLAPSMRRYQWQTSVRQVHSMDGLPAEEIRQRFLEARASDYRAPPALLRPVDSAWRRFEEISY